MLNNVILGGKIIGRGIRSSQSRDGTTVVNFRLMHKHPRAKSPVYLDVETWGAEAERTRDNAANGDYIIVHGELRMDEWVNEDGEKRTKLKLTAHRIIITVNPTDLRSASGKFRDDSSKGIDFEA